MDHAAGMRVGDRLGDRLEDRQEPRLVVGGILAVAKQSGQGTALDQLHCEVGTSVTVGAELVDRDDPGMLELTANLRLLDKPADQFGPFPVPIQEYLDGQLSSQVGVAAAEDGPHAATADLTKKLVPAEAVGQRRHVREGG